jgi:hypothetical protein
MNKPFSFLSLVLALTLLLSACTGLPTLLPQGNGNTSPNAGSTSEPVVGGNTIASPTETQTPIPSETPTQTPSPIATATATPQSTQPPAVYGPELDQFPQGVNPLTGLPVGDPALLGLPALLISITNFPASARPQAGLSSSPWVWEIYIGEGMSRFLVTFYGEEPRLEPTMRGTCEVRTGPFAASGGPVLGNRLWLDSNADGIQDSREPGIGGICITLYDAAGNVLQATSTDSNGYYGFNVDNGQTYIIGFEKIAALDFTLRDIGFDNIDSDPDPLTGLTAPVLISMDDRAWDAGYVSSAVPTPTLDPGQPTPTLPSGSVTMYVPSQVGPIRSMRTAYENIRTFFPGGCLVAASGYAGVLAQVKGCKMVYGSDEGDINSAMLDITKMRALAEANQDPNHPTNYSGNVFDPAPPTGGQLALELKVFYNYLNQALWKHDPLSGAYERYDNNPDTPESFIPESDRLNGRQLLFENIIIMIVEHNARAETWIDLDLQPGGMGRAYLFRDGQMYPIYWSTLAGDYEQTTQRLRPIKFVDADRNPFPLKPGHTWVSIFTPASGVSEQSPGIWLARFIAPKVP